MPGPPTCNDRVLAVKKKVLLRDSEALRGQTVTYCEVRGSANGSSTFDVGKAEPRTLQDHDFAPLMAFDGGAVPSDCDVSRDTRLFVLINDDWAEARNVGCGRDALTP